MSPSIARSIQGLPACARETGRSMQDALHPAGEARYPGSSALGLTPAFSGGQGRPKAEQCPSVCNGLLAGMVSLLILWRKASSPGLLARPSACGRAYVQRAARSCPAPARAPKLCRASSSRWAKSTAIDRGWANWRRPAERRGPYKGGFNVVLTAEAV